MKTNFRMSELKNKKDFFSMLCWENKNKTELNKRYGQIQTKKSTFKPCYNSLVLNFGPGAVAFFSPVAPTAGPGSGQPDTQCLYSLSSRLFGPSC